MKINKFNNDLLGRDLLTDNYRIPHYMKNLRDYIKQVKDENFLDENRVKADTVIKSFEAGLLLQIKLGCLQHAFELAKNAYINHQRTIFIALKDKYFKRYLIKESKAIDIFIDACRLEQAIISSFTSHDDGNLFFASINHKENEIDKSSIFYNGRTFTILRVHLIEGFQFDDLNYPERSEKLFFLADQDLDDAINSCATKTDIEDKLKEFFDWHVMEGVSFSDYTDVKKDMIISEIKKNSLYSLDQ